MKSLIVLVMCLQAFIIGGLMGYCLSQPLAGILAFCYGYVSTVLILWFSDEQGWI